MPEPTSTPTAGWDDPGQVGWYTQRIGKLEARRAAERLLGEILPAASRRVLDLGCGDGRLGALVLTHRPSVRELVAVDRSPPMLDRARERFAAEPRASIRTWDLDTPLSELGMFDLVVSGFAIHHLVDTRKRALFGEVASQLSPGGLFANLEVVQSVSSRRHAEFLTAVGRTADDTEDHLSPVSDQLDWMRAAGLCEVECLWRWRGFALLVGEAPLDP